ncbi:MAG: ABC transporter permease [Candidatus Gracilibacteria bacterium]|nr:ABC transporter permease [Candidatus Gracilibacteria bacterium]
MTDLITLVNKEVTRFLRIWKQTLLPPVITIVLYLLIFGKFIGSQIQIIDGVNYIDFIFPGLLMMSVIMASYGNTSSSFFGAKFQKSIEELFVSPISHTKILLGFCIGGILRGMLVGILVFITGWFMVDIHIYSYFYTILFLIFTSALFSLAGILNAIYAKSFDDINIIPSFFITPMVYLGGVFYSISLLSPTWQIISRANPILYMVNGLRYGFLGISDVDVFVSMSIILIFLVFFFVFGLYLLGKGYGIKS